jgi:hypothetical protein
MSDEKVLLEVLSSPDFKVSAQHKKRIDQRETEVAEDTKYKFGEDSNPATASDSKKHETSSLLSLFKAMSSEQRQKVIDTLKQNGLGGPLTKDKLVQNAFTVDKTIREQSSK